MKTNNRLIWKILFVICFLLLLAFEFSLLVSPVPITTTYAGGTINESVYIPTNTPLKLLEVALQMLVFDLIVILGFWKLYDLRFEKNIDKDERMINIGKSSCQIAFIVMMIFLLGMLLFGVMGRSFVFKTNPFFIGMSDRFDYSAENCMDYYLQSLNTPTTLFYLGLLCYLSAYTIQKCGLITFK